MVSRKLRVFTVPASAPFLPTLIDALLNDRLGLNFKPAGDPLALAGATLYLPTRRACRMAREVFLDALKSDAAILPRIVPIGDVDEDESAFAEAAVGELAAEALELPKALGGLERRMALAMLILKWAQRLKPDDPAQAPLVVGNPAAALMLASDLARLMDDMTTRQVSWDRLDDLVPGDMDRYWEITLSFLKFVRGYWPDILKETGKIEPAERRDRLIEAERARLERIAGPVIAAGSTGSMPATAALIETIAGLPRGAVVLPGLDTDLDDPSWDAIDGAGDRAEAAYGHPQFAMHGLLQRIGIARSAVCALAPPAAHGRERLASEALRPAAATQLWIERLDTKDFAAHADTALDDVTVVEAGNAEEEALAIAIALREAMETPGKTAALVTPDRALARRVRAALNRWNVAVDDSGGEPLADTPAGLFARLSADAALDGLSPVKLLAMLKHPLCRVDAAAVAALERAVLRGPRPKSGAAGLARALANVRAEIGRYRRSEPSTLHRTDPRLSLTDRELDAAAALVAKLADAFAPLDDLGAALWPLSEIAQRHREVIASLGSETPQLAKLFDEIVADGRIPVRPGDYAETLHAALIEVKIRAAETGARVRIYGTLESRLQSVERMVLGGLTEGTWPPETRTDPWLSRPMRHALGLDLPERRIGLSAHDFVQALGAREIVLTRAARLAGAPTVASRFVQRLAAVAGDTRWKKAVARGAALLDRARALDATPGPARPVGRPRPNPPLAARPKQLSVTDIEHWLRDPYTIYAKHILKLSPLDPVDTAPGARDRGTVIHGAIGDFAAAYAAELPDDSVAELLRFGRARFAALDDFPEAQAFWWPRFQRIARWFADFESRRRTALKAIHVEVGGRIDIPLGSETFRLTARADRIEALGDGSYAILDYKTGKPPTEKQVRIGLSPQLTLEAAILRGGGFKDIPAGASVRELIYVALRGGEPPGNDEPLRFESGPPDNHADRALEELAWIAAHFMQPDATYPSLLRPMWRTRHYGDYDHLARVKEWSVVGDDEGGGE